MKKPRLCFDSRQIWRHNSFMGMAVMMERNASSIYVSETASEESKVLAEQIEQLAHKLRISLKVRSDQVK